MSLSEIEKREEIANTTASSIQKIILGFLPGGHLVDEFVNFRSNLKLQRAISFAESLNLAINELTGIETSIYTTEEFVDIFESVLKRVLETNNQEKLLRFRNILLGHIKGRGQVDFLETFLDLTSRLHDVQIQMLEQFHLEFNIENEIKEFNILKKQKDQLVDSNEILFDTQRLKELETKLLSSSKSKDSAFFNLNEDDFLFYKQDLISKCLMKENNIILFGGEPIQVIKISQFGQKYLEFIKAN